VKINYSKNTVGCNINGEIYVHPELHKNPKLYNAVINHEKKHSNKFKGRDVLIDLFNDDLKYHKKEFYKFMFSHPRTLLGFLPLTKVGRYWGFDLELFVAWVLAICMTYFIGGYI